MPIFEARRHKRGRLAAAFLAIWHRRDMMVDNFFLATIKTITEKNLSVSELLNATEALKAHGRANFAIQLYKMWIAFNQDDPLRHIIHFNIAVLLSDSGDLPGAKEALERAIGAQPDFFPAYINFGGVLEKLGNADRAVEQWSIIVDKLALVNGNSIRFKSAALKQIGRVFEMYQRHENAENSFQKSADIDRNQPDVIEHLLSSRMLQCKWPVVSPWEGVTRKMLMTDISPLSLCAYSDDPILQLASSSHHNKVSVGIPAVNLQVEQCAANVVSDSGRRRIGYLSSDLRGHAIGYLMAELFELHDRSAFEVFVYYCGPQASDAMQARIKSSVEHWVDISRIDDDTAARRIAADGIDILIDVNGYTRDARTKVAAMRPAPIIVNWLGYPGTMASPYHHYIIADEWIIPKDHEIYFSERVLRLPCYQPNDRKRVTSPTPPSRQQAGLPDDAFVYCCFNGVQKLTRFTFERWISILERVPNSVLWLLDGTDVVNKHLAASAESRGIAPERLVFAGKMGHSDHLARYSLADLFLDTVPYGAHTTASDALWAGVPILTLSGRSFASRVCGSLARSAGLAELVCNTPEDYVERAVALANDRPKIQQYKQHLKATRDTCVLFKTDDLVQHLESLYRQMYEEFQQGMLPSPDLRNLDVYHDVGLEEDHDALEVMTIKNYQEWYKAKLARRHAVWPIPADNRLWTP